MSILSADDSLASAHQSVLDHQPLHPHSLEVRRLEYLTGKARYDHFAPEKVAEKVQESAPGKAHLQSRVGGGCNLEQAAQWAGSPFGRAGLGVELFQNRLLQAFEQLGLQVQTLGYQQIPPCRWIQTYIYILSRAPGQASLDFQLVAAGYVTSRK